MDARDGADDRERALEAAHEAALAWLRSLEDRPVWPRAGLDEMLEAFGGPLPEDGTDPAAVVEQLAAGAGPGLVAIPGGRFFGFVIGGTLPAALAADWLVSAWEQNSGSAMLTPTTVALERIAGQWMVDLFGLPKAASVGFVTGGQVAASRASWPRVAPCSPAPTGTSASRASAARRACASSWARPALLDRPRRALPRDWPRRHRRRAGRRSSPSWRSTAIMRSSSRPTSGSQRSHELIRARQRDVGSARVEVLVLWILGDVDPSRAGSTSGALPLPGLRGEEPFCASGKFQLRFQQIYRIQNDSMGSGYGGEATDEPWRDCARGSDGFVRSSR